VVVVVKDGKTIFTKGYGYGDIEKKTPVVPNKTIFRIGSITKVFTATAVMQLADRGKISLEDDINKYLKGFQVPNTYQQPITFANLLTHTSGLGYDTWNADVMKYRQVTGIPAVGSCQNAALTTPLLFEPGERWEYGISIDWVGKLVEAASGQRLDRYMTERLFNPLGMHDTGFAIGPAQRLRKAKMHTRSANGFNVMEHEIPQTPEFHMGGGGLYSTAVDYLKFTQALLADGGPILKPETVKLMGQNHMAEGVLCRPLKSQLAHMSTDLDFVDGMKWGLSFMINPTAFPGRRSANSLTWGGLANSYYWIDPVKKVTGVWATQLLPFYDPRAIGAFENFERAVYANA